MNVCRGTKYDMCLADSAACLKTWDNQFISLGLYSSVVYSYSGGLVAQYSGGTEGYTMQITFGCNSRMEKGRPIFLTENPSGNFQFQWNTIFACPATANDLAKEETDLLSSSSSYPSDSSSSFYHSPSYSGSLFPSDSSNPSDSSSYYSPSSSWSSWSSSYYSSWSSSYSSYSSWFSSSIFSRSSSSYPSWSSWSSWSSSWTSWSSSPSGSSSQSSSGSTSGSSSGSASFPTAVVMGVVGGGVAVAGVFLGTVLWKKRFSSPSLPLIQPNSVSYHSINREQ